MDRLERRETYDAGVRRSLLDRRQALGIMPTWWFWNDWERQRLLMPLTLATAAPLTVLFFAAAAAGISVWWTVAFSLVYPVVLMGVVERYVRASLGRRGDDVVAVREDAPRRPASVRVASLLGALLSAAVLAGIGGAPLVVTLGLALSCGAVLGWLLVPKLRTRVRRLQANATRALGEGDER